jgi:hypothetical protein
MTAKGIDEQSIKKAVARRAKEFGYRIGQREVTLEFMDAETAPGCRIFRAWWGAGEAQGSLSGLLRDEEEPDTYPGRALGKVFQRWIETAGRLPDARLAATVAAFLYDASDLHRVILSDEDKAAFVKRPEWLPHVQLPETIEVAGQPGIAFWWVGPSGASRMRAYLSSSDQVRTEETFIRDLLKEGGADS